MKVSEFIIEEISNYGTKDAFGIPGGVILPFLYALDNSDVTPHLTYHEQTAAFAACGYAQASGNLGVAYATRGPGICNMFTAIAEAYQESLPVIFVTAHGNRGEHNGQRFTANQEMEIVKSVREITKYAANIDTLEEVVSKTRCACKEAISGRKGPVLIDVHAGLWDKEICVANECASNKDLPGLETVLAEVRKEIESSSRPVLLIGEGLRHSCKKEILLEIANKLGIPILSSRGSQDILSGSPYYYGYVGSHGIRYSNFILSKADLILSVGNRLAFPHTSKSFSPILKQAKLIRIDIDPYELNSKIKGEISYNVDVKQILRNIEHREFKLGVKKKWLEVCENLKDELEDEDCVEPVKKIEEFISKQSSSNVYVCDVGNNEFWFSRAYEKCQCVDVVLISKSFGTLGASIGKAIGAYHATGKSVVCVVGDQGLQYNIQEFQYIALHKIPITILVLNNKCSGMIADHEKNRFNGKLIHVTENTEYSSPNFLSIAKAYGIEEKIVEIVVEEKWGLTPFLPKGNVCQDMSPALEEKRYAKLNRL